jgi:hypothetical protein
MKITIEVGTDIVDAFPDCDVERSLSRYADQVADAARERYPDADVTYRIDTRCGFGLRIDGLDDTEALREDADRIWTEQTWVVDPRAEALDPGAVHVDGRTYRVGRAEWLVLTDDEADEMAAERIVDTLWAFRPEFLANHMPRNINQRAIEALGEIQEKLCKDANCLIEALIDVDDVVRDAIGTDGRGHFLAGYDGHEVELRDGFFAYRVG